MTRRALPALALVAAALFAARSIAQQSGELARLAGRLAEQNQLLEQVVRDQRDAGRAAGACAAARDTSALERSLAELQRTAAAQQAPTDGQTRAAEPVQARERTDAQAHAADRAEAVIHRALGRRSWTPADRDEMRTLFERVRGDDQQQLLSRILTGLNDGSLSPDVGGPPI